jgi:hypothetical protein
VISRGMLTGGVAIRASVVWPLAQPRDLEKT